MFESYETVDVVKYDNKNDAVHLASGPARLAVGREALLSYSSIIWTHDCLSASLRGFLEADPKNAPKNRYYLIRDPRAVYLSLCHHVTRPEYFKIFSNARIKSPEGIMEDDTFVTKWMIQWKSHVEGYLNNQDWFALVRFEDLVSKKKETVRYIANQVLGDSPKVDAAVCDVLKKTGFNVMKSKSPTHVRSGRADDFRSELPERVLTLINAMVQPELDTFGYSI